MVTVCGPDGRMRAGSPGIDKDRFAVAPSVQDTNDFNGRCRSADNYPERSLFIRRDVHQCRVAHAERERSLQCVRQFCRK